MKFALRFTRAIAISGLCVDASIAICWLMPDEHEPDADAILTRVSANGAIVPGIFWYEVRNGLIMNERRGRLNIAETTSALQMLGMLPLSTDPTQDESMLMNLSRLHELTVYDAAYLEVAKRRGLELATFDRLLAKAALAEGVPSLKPSR